MKRVQTGAALATTLESAVLIAARTKVVLGPLLLLLNSAAAEATEIHILAPTTIRPVINALAPEFEHTTGYKLVVEYDVAPVVKRQVAGGAAFDIVIVTRPLMDDLTQGRIVPETRFDVGRAGAGVAVQTGSAQPTRSGSSRWAAVPF
jgi:ABC-type molybdate transport system substrate-binding protein